MGWLSSKINNSPSASGGRPRRPDPRPFERSAMLDRATPSVSHTAFIANRPSATTATATSVFLSPPPIQGRPSESRLPSSSCRANAATRAPGSGWRDTWKTGRGPEVGMTFGAVLRVCGQLATLLPQMNGQVCTPEERDLRCYYSGSFGNSIPHSSITNRGTTWRLARRFAHRIISLAFATSVQSLSGRGVMPTRPRSSRSESQHV